MNSGWNLIIVQGNLTGQPYINEIVCLVFVPFAQHIRGILSTRSTMYLHTELVLPSTF